MYASTSTLPLTRADSAMAIADGWLAPSGFSHRTCLPASRAAIVSWG